MAHVLGLVGQAVSPAIQRWTKVTGETACPTQNRLLNIPTQGDR